MTRIRRYYASATPVFITAVCHERRPYLRLPERKDLLLAVMREVKAELAFRMLAYAVLDDHFHWMIVPAVPTDFPRIMQSVKLRFSRRVLRVLPQEGPRLWQRRYWDHLIRDAGDLERHLDYIHFNPVRHGYVDSPLGYRWSSFQEYVDRGRYGSDWGAHGAPPALDGFAPE